jgi:hypothetical protein
MSEIVINDRRMFNKDGSINDSRDGEGESKPAPEPLKKKEAAQKVQTDEEKAGDWAKEEYDKRSTSEVVPNLATLMVGLATSAYMQMGEAHPDGRTPPQPPDIPAAKHTIDLLAVLQKKTKGNLEPDEESLLSAILYELRMKYLSLTAIKK